MNIALHNIHKLPQREMGPHAGIHNYVFELIKQGYVKYLFFDDWHDQYTRSPSTILHELFQKYTYTDLGLDHVEVTFSKKKILSTCDVLLNFNGTLPSDFTPTIKAFQGVKIFHLIDYFWLEPGSEKNRRLVDAGVDYLMSYSRPDLYCRYFQKTFPTFIGKVIPVPFGFAPRFTHTIPFENRIQKCIALGSVNPLRPHNVDEKNYQESARFFSEEKWFHKFRRSLVEHTTELAPVMDSLLPSYPSIKNFRYDIVNTLNRYQFFTSCESIFYFPSGKTFEGPASGSVLVCSDHPCFTDYGFVDGKNCITHQQFNVSDFKEKVRYYIEHQEELHTIQRAGTEMVQHRYSHRAIAQRLASIMSNIYNAGAAVDTMVIPWSITVPDVPLPPASHSPIKNHVFVTAGKIGSSAMKRAGSAYISAIKPLIRLARPSTITETLAHPIQTLREHMIAKRQIALTERQKMFQARRANTERHDTKPTIIFSACQNAEYPGDAKYNGGIKLMNVWVQALRQHGYDASIATQDGTYQPWLIEHQPCISLNTLMEWKAQKKNIRYVTTWLRADAFIDIADTVYFFDAEGAYTMGAHYQRLQKLLAKKIVSLGTHSPYLQAWYMSEFELEPYYIREWSDTTYWTPAPEKRIRNRIGYMIESASTEQEIEMIKKILDTLDVTVEFMPITGDEQEVLNAMQSCDVYLGMNTGKQVLWGEGCPRTQQEAMHAGCAVIAYDVKGNQQYLLHEFSGLLVPTGKTEELAAALVRVLQNTDLKERLRQQGHAIVRTIHSGAQQWKHITQFLGLE